MHCMDCMSIQMALFASFATTAVAAAVDIDVDCCRECDWWTFYHHSLTRTSFCKVHATIARSHENRGAYPAWKRAHDQEIYRGSSNNVLCCLAGSVAHCTDCRL